VADQLWFMTHIREEDWLKIVKFLYPTCI